MTTPESSDRDREQARREFETRSEAARVAGLEAEADMAGERVTTEQENRRLRFGVAIAALVLMALQVLLAVVLVIVNYLFPNEGREYA